MEYILLIHNNAIKPVLEKSSVGSVNRDDPESVELRNQKQWDSFLSAARQSGVFNGGSAIGCGELIGATDVNLISEKLAGHMRFSTHGIADGLEVIHQLLLIHPTVLNGGTVELCEMPRTGE